jgi:hypothetical protein
MPRGADATRRKFFFERRGQTTEPATVSRGTSLADTKSTEYVFEHIHLGIDP